MAEILDVDQHGLEVLKKSAIIPDDNFPTRLALRTSISGGTIDAVPSGLQTGFLVTTIDIPDTATLLPQNTRNGFSIFNTNQTEILYIGPTSSVTADTVLGTTSGWEIGPQETANYDCKETIDFYAIAPTGKTIRVKIFEVA